MHYNGANSYLFVNGTEIYKSNTKDSGIAATPLCLGNISKDFSVDDMKKIGLNGCVYDFSADYDTTAVDDILDIHKYLMKKNKMSFFSCNALKCVSMNNQKRKVRPEIVNINSNDPYAQLVSASVY